MTSPVRQIIVTVLGLIGFAALSLALLSALDGSWLALIVLLPGIVIYVWGSSRGAR